MSSTGLSELVDPLGRPIPLEVQVNRQARRIILKVDPARATGILVIPSERRRGEGLRFAASRAAWLAARLARVPARVPFADGVAIPLLGLEHRIVHSPDARSPIQVAEREIRVGGRAERLPALVGGWLRTEARRLLAQRSRQTAAALGLAVRRVAVRDPTSRWGSCSTSGGLSYSWRLILAPEPVLTYVVAHEVAHLREANHGPRFWRLVAELDPGHVAARRWLREHGATLHRYG